MKITKSEKYSFEPRKYSQGVPITFKLHYEKDVNEYVLCQDALFFWTHYTESMLKEMLRVLENANKKNPKVKAWCIK